jgi:NodT family efflux transporter outer membrane factor (OMF) lipoprotein
MGSEENMGGASKPFAKNLTAKLAVFALLSLAGPLTGCTVGPKYVRPEFKAPPAYKELTPETEQNLGWKPAQPADATLHGNWWEMFNDPQLNSLEVQVNISNQNIAASTAAFMAARALITEARAQYYPTVSVSPSVTKTKQSANAFGGSAGGAAVPGLEVGRSFTEYNLPFDVSWQADLWGRVRNTVRSNIAAAQVSAADLENVRLTAQAQLAIDYYELRNEDSLKQLLDSTVMAYRQSLDLTQVLYETGIDSQESVSQAATQLQATQAQDTAVGILRAQYEHAIALLTGQPASTFSLSFGPLEASPPVIPYGVPSQLLERRPDIASAERAMAQANAQIGIATAAYYPTLSLSASAGLESTSPATWFTWPSRLWSVGPALAETIFDAGLRGATVQQFRANYDQAVANYRGTVLSAFQQVEDDLASLRYLSTEIQQQDNAVKSAQETLTVATDRYRLGIDPYLNVITAQTALLSNEQTAENLRMQEMVAAVQLIEALGGGWDTSQLPSPSDVASSQPAQTTQAH